MRRLIWMILTLTLWGFIAGPVPAAEEKFSSQEVLMAMEDAFAEVAERVKPAVVHITVEPSGEGLDDTAWDDLRRQLPPELRERLPDLPEIPREGAQTGSGMIFEYQDGTAYILTNAHVVGQAETVQVKLLAEKQERKAEVIGRDTLTDVAIVKMDSPEPLPTVTFGDSSKLRVGSFVMAIGSPFEFEASVTVGIVSATGREIAGQAPQGFSYRDLIQTDAAINPGNSGGPLVNLRGEVVGINQMIYTRTMGFMGIGFAIPINTAKRVLQELREKGFVTRGWLGVRMLDLEEYAIRNKIDLERVRKELGVNQGALVQEVEPGSPAAEAGVQPNDVLIEFNGVTIDSADQLQTLVQGTPPGQEVEIKVLRARQERTLKVQVGTLPGRLIGQTPRPTREFGMAVTELTPDQAKRMGLEGRQGVLVERVQPGSPAAEAGLQPGDVIIAIQDANGNRQAINNLGDYRRLMGETKDLALVFMVIVRVEGGQTRELGIMLYRGEGKAK